MTILTLEEKRFLDVFLFEATTSPFEPSDEDQLERALQEAHRQAKEQVLRHVELA